VIEVADSFRGYFFPRIAKLFISVGMPEHLKFFFKGEYENKGRLKFVEMIEMRTLCKSGKQRP